MGRGLETPLVDDCDDDYNEEDEYDSAKELRIVDLVKTRLAYMESRVRYWYA